MQAVALARVGTAAGPLADHGAAWPQLLQVVGELLGAGERGRPDQHVQRLGGAEPRTRHVRRRPGLHGLAGVPLVHGHQVRLLVQQVAADQRDRARVAAAVLPQVEQQRVGVRHQLQCQAERRTGELHREQLRRQREVHDVAVEPVDPGDPVQRPGRVPGPRRPVGLLVPLLRQRFGVVPQPQVQVAVEGLQVLGDHAGQRGRVDQRPVRPVAGPVGQQVPQPRADVGEHVVLGDQVAGAVHDVGDLGALHGRHQIRDRDRAGPRPPRSARSRPPAG